MAGRMVKAAASTILITRNSVTFEDCNKESSYFKQKMNQEDYAVMLLKRSSKIRFMPSLCVFPGGTHDLADSDNLWQKLFAKCGVMESSLQQQFKLADSIRAPLYTRLEKVFTQPHGNEVEIKKAMMDNSLLIPEVALRITAIRETFEETGLLLAMMVCGNSNRHQPVAITKEKTFLIEGNNCSQTNSTLECGDIGGCSLSEWRTEVIKDSSKFVELFTLSNEEQSNMTLLPWLWGLVEWWSWLTPLNVYKRRYDTMFYTAVLPGLVLDSSMLSYNSESETLQVLPPSIAMKNWMANDIDLAVPQIYEFGRLCRFSTMEQLQQHINGRVITEGTVAAPVDTWLPDMFSDEDGFVSLLPGDELYNNNYNGDPGSSPAVEYTLEQLRRHSNVATSHADGCGFPLNRVEKGKSGDISVHVNSPQTFGQVIPKNVKKVPVCTE